MIDPFKEINWRPVASDLRKFSRSLIIGFPCLSTAFFLVKWTKTQVLPDTHYFLMLGGIGTSIGLVCLLIPIIARPLYYIWYAVAACIGLVMANLFFALMFYALFTPMGLFMRLIGRDALNLKRKRGSVSYWIDAPQAKPAERYFSQF